MTERSSQFQVAPEEDNRNLDERFAAEREDAEDMRRTVESGFAEHKVALDDEADLEEARPLREELERRYPGRASETVETYLSFDAIMRKDPVDGAHKLAEHYSRNGARPIAAPELAKADEWGDIAFRLPDGRTEKVREGSVRHTALQAAAKVQADRGELDRLRGMQKDFAKRFPGQKFTAVLRDALEFDRNATKDPYRAAALLAAKYGMPIGDEQVAQQHEQQQRATEVGRLIDTEFQHLKGREAEVLGLVKSGILRPDPNDMRGSLRNATKALAMQAECATEIKAFAASHPDYPAVRHALAALIESGKAKDLEDAYAKVQSRTIADDVRTAANRRL